jgi:Peptidase family M23
MTSIQALRIVVVLMLFLQVPLAAAAIQSWRASSQVEWAVWTLASLVYGLMLHLVLIWPQTSLALRPLTWLLIGVALASCWRLTLLPRGSLTVWSGGLLALTVVVLLPAVIRASSGRSAPPEAEALGPVLRGGTFVVEQGGSHEIINYHMRHLSLRYAVDFIGVRPLGRHAQGLFPKEPDRYAIFAAAVLAPCDAVVETAVDGVPDLPGPHTDPRHPAGNHVVLLMHSASSGERVRVALAHLQQGSLQVQVGQRVQSGQVIARVGHSGNSSEPHLHMGVVQGDPWQGTGLPFTVAGRFPVRGMIFRTAQRAATHRHSGGR